MVQYPSAARHRQRRLVQWTAVCPGVHQHRRATKRCTVSARQQPGRPDQTSVAGRLQDTKRVKASLLADLLVADSRDVTEHQSFVVFDRAVDRDLPRCGGQV